MSVLARSIHWHKTMRAYSMLSLARFLLRDQGSNKKISYWWDVRGICIHTFVKIWRIGKKVSERSWIKKQLVNWWIHGVLQCYVSIVTKMAIFPWCYFLTIQRSAPLKPNNLHQYCKKICFYNFHAPISPSSPIYKSFQNTSLLLTSIVNILKHILN